MPKPKGLKSYNSYNRKDPVQREECELKIVDLLKNSELMAAEIATRMGVSDSEVSQVNKKYNIRERQGIRKKNSRSRGYYDE